MSAHLCAELLPVTDVSFDSGDLAFNLIKILKSARFDDESERESAKESIARVSSLLGLDLTPVVADYSSVSRHPVFAKWQMSRLQEYIDSRIDQNISIGDLSSFVHLSVSHFARAFKKVSRETPHTYIVRRRVAHAKHLLVSTTIPLSEIAMNCGFSDTAHLCKIFKRFVGQTPATWRTYRQRVISTAYDGFPSEL